MGTVRETTNIRITNYDDAGDRITIGSDVGGVNRFGLDYNSGTETFVINQGGATWTNGVTTYTTPLNKIGELNTALPAVRIPPNTTTFKLNNTLLCDAGTSGKTTSVADGSIIVNNNTGGTVTPAITLNQTGTAGGVLVEEIYNQRTATTGEFNRMSFYAKSSTGAKIEYARIHQNAPSITMGATRGRLDFDVNVSGTSSNYLSLNGSSGTVEINNSTLNLNSNSIVGCSNISTPPGNFYVKGVNEYYSSPSYSSPTILEDKLRWVGVSLGKQPNWVQDVGVSSFPGTGVENVTASQYGFNGCWWVGTDLGNVYYTSDGGATWTLQGSYGGRINCFETYSSGSYMAVGGAFNTSYQYLFAIDSGFGSFDMTSGSNGLNAEVRCFYNNTANFCLFIGGSFDAFNGGSSFSLKFITYDYGSSNWYPFSNSSGSGFTGGDVYSIARDSSTSLYVVGGNFTNVTVSGFSSGLSYLFTYQTSMGYDVSSYFGIGASLNNPVYSVLPYSSGVIVGGSFTNPLVYPSWTDSYGIYITWNGTNWDLNNIPFYQPQGPITQFIYISTTGDYFTIVDSGSFDTLIKGSIQMPNIPVGSRWNCIVYNGSNTCYATNNQPSAGFVFYNLNQSTALTITASGGQTFNTYGNLGLTNIIMYGAGSSFEFIYNISSNSWWVIALNGSALS